ncbi:MAG TPA: sigma factor [Flavitalea sp.]|nr:sigma factor [Flavitalea sp.]
MFTHQNRHLTTLELKKEKCAWVYDSYSSLLYGEILQVFPKREIANEILVSSFLKIWNKLEQYDSSENLYTWALKITRKEIRMRKINAVLNELFACQQKEGILH